jgi:hypothetical protein
MIIEQASNLIKCWTKFYESPEFIGKSWYIGWSKFKYDSGEPLYAADEKISVHSSDELLSADLTRVADELYKDYPYWKTLSTARKVALISFAHSTGYTFGSEEHLELNHALEFDLDSVPEVFNLYNETEGKLNEKLIQRRMCEGLIWDGVDLSTALLKCRSAKQERDEQSMVKTSNPISDPVCPMPESTAKKVKKGLSQKLDM